MKEHMHEKCQRLVDKYGPVPKDIPLEAYIEELGEVNGTYFHIFFNKHEAAPAAVSNGAHMSIPPMRYAILDKLSQLRKGKVIGRVLPDPTPQESAS